MEGPMENNYTEGDMGDECNDEHMDYGDEENMGMMEEGEYGD